MAKPIVLTEPQWNKLEKHLRNTLPLSVMALRSKMRRVLGMTPREHRTYTEQRGSEVMVHLDFFDDQRKTMFCLKYSEFLNK
jgi:hypothetical protein